MFKRATEQRDSNARAQGRIQSAQQGAASARRQIEAAKAKKKNG